MAIEIGVVGVTRLMRAQTSKASFGTTSSSSRFASVGSPSVSESAIGSPNRNGSPASISAASKDNEQPIAKPTRSSRQ